MEEDAAESNAGDDDKDPAQSNECACTAAADAAPSSDDKKGGGGGGKVVLSLAKKKKKKLSSTSKNEQGGGRRNDGDWDVGAARRNRNGDVGVAMPVSGSDELSRPAGPLVIPVAKNTNQRPGGVNTGKALSKEDEEAAKALQQQAEANGNDDERGDGKLVIDGGGDKKGDGGDKEKKLPAARKDDELDVSDLPDELPLDSEGYRRVPIEQFGAALLRGMGWKDDNDDKKKKKSDDEPSMPRPHRLGLGATPKVMLPDDKDDDGATSRRRPRRPDQVKRQERQQKEQDEYRRQRERQMEMDKQRTLQNGSIVYLNLDKKIRARIVQLVGVPGLNNVKVRIENDAQDTVVKRGDVDELVPRQDLESDPFRERKKVTEKPIKQETQRRVGEVHREKDGRDRRPSSSSSQKREGRREHEDEKETTSSSKKRRREDYDRDDDRWRGDSATKKKKDSHHSKPNRLHEWIIPHIRVRIVTEKLGRKHFKEKGVVVDVTPAGATIKMSNGSLLDRVPERYLETALPKPGGKAIVLAPCRKKEYRFAKGKLLERNSREGAMQVYADQSVVTVPLDDMAEWCGPLDEDDNDY